MTKANDHLLVFNPSTDIGLGLIGCPIAPLDLECHLICAAMLGATQGTDGSGDCRVKV